VVNLTVFCGYLNNIQTTPLNGDFSERRSIFMNILLEKELLRLARGIGKSLPTMVGFANGTVNPLEVKEAIKEYNLFFDEGNLDEEVFGQKEDKIVNFFLGKYNDTLGLLFPEFDEEDLDDLPNDFFNDHGGSAIEQLMSDFNVEPVGNETKELGAAYEAKAAVKILLSSYKELKKFFTKTPKTT
jgi:hypothetical protein